MAEAFTVEHEGVVIKCASAADAARLALELGKKSKGEAVSKPSEAPTVEVLDARGNGNGHGKSSRTVETLEEVKGAVEVIWDFMTNEKDPKARLWDLLGNTKK